MSRFTGELTLTHLDLDWRIWRLESTLIYEIGDEGSGRIIAVKPPFYTDGASIPRIFWGVLPPWGQYSRAAVVHDYLGYLAAKNQPHPEAPDQRTADAIFYEAMGVAQVGLVVRFFLWSAVRLADRFPWLRTLGVRTPGELIEEPGTHPERM